MSSVDSDGQGTIVVQRSARKKKRASKRRPRARPSLHTGSIYSHPTILPPEFCGLVSRLESHLKAPIWLIVQNDPPKQEFSEITSAVYKGFQDQIGVINEIPATGLLLESPGGFPHYAFRISRLFQRRTPNLLTIVPQFAKSAATMIALGGNRLILGREAELGPLDLQVFDRDQETMDTALNSVQALERLQAFGMVAIDQTMQLLMQRTHKRTDVLLPIVLKYVAASLSPLMRKIDTIDFARKSRQLKVVEEYAARLMRRQYGLGAAKSIARRLVRNYPDHGFVIDSDEAIAVPSDMPEGLDDDGRFGLGIRAERADKKAQDLIDELMPYLDSLSVIGRVVEVPNGN